MVGVLAALRSCQVTLSIKIKKTFVGSTSEVAKAAGAELAMLVSSKMTVSAIPI